MSITSSKPLTDISGDLLPTCVRCKDSITTGHAYELGYDRWHTHCFSCYKCEKPLSCDSDFLVLGTGALICFDCSDSCKKCGKKIDDLAIILSSSNEAYCSDCFICCKCGDNIKDLRYAKTKRGLFCLNCHEKLLEKRKYYEERKRRLKKNLPVLPHVESKVELTDRAEDSATLDTVNHKNKIVSPLVVPERSSSRPVSPIRKTDLSSAITPKTTPLIVKSMSDNVIPQVMEEKDYKPREARKEHRRNKSIDDILEATLSEDDNHQEQNTLDKENDKILLNKTPLRNSINENMSRSPKSYRRGLVISDKITSSNNSIKYDGEQISRSNSPKKTGLDLKSRPDLRLGPSTSISSSQTLELSHDSQLTYSKSEKSIGDLKDIENNFNKQGDTVNLHSLNTFGKPLIEGQTHTDSNSKLLNDINSNLLSPDRSSKTASKLIEGDSVDNNTLPVTNMKSESKTNFESITVHSTSPLKLHPEDYSSRNGILQTGTDKSLSGQGLVAETLFDGELMNSQRTLKLLQEEIKQAQQMKENLLNEVDEIRSTKDNLLLEIEKIKEEMDNATAASIITSVEKSDYQQPVSYSEVLLDDSSIARQTNVASVGRTVKPRFWKFFGGKQNGQQLQSNHNQKDMINTSTNVVSDISSVTFSRPDISSPMLQNPNDFKDVKKFPIPHTRNEKNSGSNGSQLYSATLSQRCAFENSGTPHIITECINYIESNEENLKTEGIYRKSASQLTVEQLETKFANGKPVELSHYDIHVSTSLLKRYLRKLPNPVITYQSYETLVNYVRDQNMMTELPIGKGNTSDQRNGELMDILMLLPKEHIYLLRLLAAHINTVIQYTEWNLMNRNNLVLVFAPGLMRDYSGEKDIVDMRERNYIVSFIFENFRDFVQNNN